VRQANRDRTSLELAEGGQMTVRAFVVRGTTTTAAVPAIRHSDARQEVSLG